MFNTTHSDSQTRFDVLGGGEFGLEFDKPSTDTSTIDVRDSGVSTWYSDGDKHKFIAKCLVAFSAFINERHPQLEGAIYTNNAIADSIYTNNAIADSLEAGDYNDLTKLKDMAEWALYRVRYYEKLGFKFAVPYETQVDAVVEELVKSGEYSGEAVEIQFDGNLVHMSQSIPKVYPECKLRSFRTGLR